MVQEKHEIECEVCGKKKTVTRGWAKYCGRKCNMLAWARRELKKEGEKKMKTIVVLLVLIGMAGSAYAYNPFETTSDYEERSRAENYYANRDNTFRTANTYDRR